VVAAQRVTTRRRADVRRPLNYGDGRPQTHTSNRRL